MDCRYLHGWLLGRPVPVPDLRALMSSFDPSVLEGGEVPKMDTGVH
jgi:hypothetical protein